MSKNMRTEMPKTAAFVDSMREAFGDDHVNQQIRAGLRGSPTFWALENGHEIGTRDASAKVIIGRDDAGRSFAVEVPAGATLEIEAALVKTARSDSNRKSHRGGVVRGRTIQERS